MADSSHVANEASARETETSSTPPVTEKEAVKTARADEQDLPESKEERRDVETAGDSRQPTGWKYKRISVGPIKLPPYASPGTQLVLVAFVCFLCPGMFNALGGLGGGGQVDPTVANNAGVALNSTFSIVGFFAGTLVNRLGIKLTLSIGGLGYCIYAASFLSYSHTANAGFNIFAGALLGVCAGLLWAAQGTIMMSYPQESSKGRYISWFWMIFNLGGVIGSLIPLGQNINNTATGTVTDGTYIGFIILMFFGAVLAWTLVDARHVRRADGSHVILMKHPTWQSEIFGLWEVLRSDPYILLLFPMFFASNWFYTYQFQDVNLARFNLRTRALNNTLYWISQIAGAYVFGFALDINVKRTIKAKVALAVLFALTMIIWGGGYVFQNGHTRAPADADPKVVEAHKLDWAESAYIGPMFLYMFYGFYDAAWQTCIYWYMGSLTNNSRKLANFTGFYKGIQSAGAAIISRVDALKAPYMSNFAASWALLAGSLVIAAPVIFTKIRDFVPLEEDLKFSDETIEDVAPPGTEAAEHIR